MTSPDGAAQAHGAGAVSEIFVVSANEIGSSWPDHMMAQYWDTLVAGVTGNFRKLLEDVTLNPAMGYYLNTKGNQKENAPGPPARRELRARGHAAHDHRAATSSMPTARVKTGADGAPLDSYTQDDVTNLARVFTGYDLDIAAAERNGFTPPAPATPSRATPGPGGRWRSPPPGIRRCEASFLGATVPANTEGTAALKIALDTLFNHPNVGPFIGKQLIQRLVTSNPSPAYVERVADVFADNGAGVRGDMKSVFAAVLLDNEARSPAGLADPNFGRLREPMLRLVQWAPHLRRRPRPRAPGRSATARDPATTLGQSPLRSPSVFNFFRPGYVPPSHRDRQRQAGGARVPDGQRDQRRRLPQLHAERGAANGFNSKDVIAELRGREGAGARPGRAGATG